MCAVIHWSNNLSTSTESTGVAGARPHVVVPRLFTIIFGLLLFPAFIFQAGPLYIMGQCELQAHILTIHDSKGRERTSLFRVHKSNTIKGLWSSQDHLPLHWTSPYGKGDGGLWSWPGLGYLRCHCWLLSESHGWAGSWIPKGKGFRASGNNRCSL